MTKRVLFVAYSFPPVGGAGVQRVVKFVKYLPKHGWRSSVLTVSNPSAPVADATLLGEVPPTTVVARAPTWEPSYRVKQTVSAAEARPAHSARSRSLRLTRWIGKLARSILQPDPQILWAVPAYRRGRQLLQDLPHDAIIASGPPFSTLLIGAALSRQSGLPLVLDFRDEWELSDRLLENKQTGWPGRRLQQRLQRKVLRAASQVLATTRASAGRLANLCRQQGSPALSTAIYNGFDAEDFQAQALDTMPRQRVRFVYVGTLWNLTDVHPLVTAVETLIARSPALAQRLELMFVGRRTAEQDRWLDRLEPTPVRLRRHDYVDHAAAIREMRKADVLCLILSDVPGAERVVPAKLFEYLAAGRSILAVTPPGEVPAILRECRHARVCHPADSESITACLKQLIESANERFQLGVSLQTHTYSRSYQAGQLAQILDQLVDGTSNSPPPESRSHPGRTAFRGAHRHSKNVATL